MIVIVDRVESGFAVCETENGTFVSIDISAFAGEIVVGGAYELSSGQYVYNPSLTEQNRLRIEQLLREVFE